ncbi:hypothetical protein XELAEV_18046974mg [Xenopus laevis]|uniref:Uncharacterized protein n=1 Tax=Xenopus laevis TaxID=8355 RepID=A0A974H130_XENLA|nr:hypothetical protein XELAEV_18046974mg [Xenopus laevis]
MDTVSLENRGKRGGAVLGKQSFLFLFLISRLASLSYFISYIVCLIYTEDEIGCMYLSNHHFICLNWPNLLVYLSLSEEDEANYIYLIELYFTAGF